MRKKNSDYQSIHLVELFVLIFTTSAFSGITIFSFISKFGFPKDLVGALAIAGLAGVLFSTPWVFISPYIQRKIDLQNDHYTFQGKINMKEK